jgi:hypothetical protein
MDKEEARFILRCFRPDGADAENPDFAEALAWAAKDRELGEWLARERASDAGFARALSTLGIPASLREEILAGLAVERGDDAGIPDAFDACVIGALAAVRPPAGLRGEILAAMERTPVPAASSKKIAWRFGLPLAAAAGIALAFLLSGPGGAPTEPLVGNDSPGGGLVDPGNLLTISLVEQDFINKYEAASPKFTLDLENPDHHALFDHLLSKKLPCPSRCLPEGLKKFAGDGCRELEIGGKRGAVVCFKKDNDKVHLVVFKRCDVKCKLPATGKPDFRERGNWSVARWSDDEWVFVLMGKEGVDVKRLEEMF